MARISTNRTNNAVDQKDSRYVQGGVTDRYPNRLGWWERKEFPRSDTDLTITVLASEEGRPDLIAYRIYGKSNLDWLVLQYNAIVDTTTEIVEGAELILPTPRRVVLDIMTNQTGGNRVS